jgi:16S rRNA (guanine1207-N2)-methyltransferase
MFRLFAPKKGCGYTAHYFTDNRNLTENRKEHSFLFSGHSFSFITDNGVFSKTGIDSGSEILLSTIAKKPLSGKVLDMGCGYGTISVVLKKLFPDISVTAVDINPRAVELAQLNCEGNGTDCSVFVSDGFEKVSGMFDHVITNPPIRAGKKTIYRMFEDAYTHLNIGGTLTAVIRRKQGAESAVRKFDELFHNCTVLCRDKGYWVLESRKLTDLRENVNIIN